MLPLGERGEEVKGGEEKDVGQSHGEACIRGAGCGGSGRGGGAWHRVTTFESGVAVSSRGAEVDEAWLVGGDHAEDPCLILGHSGIYSREIGPGTWYTKAHHS